MTQYKLYYVRFHSNNTKLRASSIHISETARGQLLKFCVPTVQKISNKSVQFSMLLAEQFLSYSTLKIVKLSETKIH